MAESPRLTFPTVPTTADSAPGEGLAPRQTPAPPSDMGFAVCRHWSWPGKPDRRDNGQQVAPRPWAKGDHRQESAAGGLRWWSAIPGDRRTARRGGYLCM